MRPTPTPRIYTSKNMLQARLIAAAGTLLALAALWVVCLLLKNPNIWAVLAVAVIAVIGTAAVALVLVGFGRSGLLYEYRIRSRFKAVCRSKNLADRAKNPKGRDTWRYPRVSGLTGNKDSFQATIKPLLGHSLADWDKAAPALALGFGATTARVQHDGNGRLLLKVGYAKVAAHEFEHRDQVADDTVNWGQRLAAVEIGKLEDGRPWLLRVIGSHLLIVGITGAGKGSVIWSIVLRLLPAVRAGVVRFWGIDPKRMELAYGRAFFADRYAATTDEIVALLERIYVEMMARADELGGKVRKFKPSRLHPLEVIIVDEFAFLVSLLPDKKKRDRAEEIVSSILILGRSSGFVLLAASQEARKSVIDCRDLFPTRIAMRVPKGQVDLILGHGMYEAGAQCDLIPATETDGAGVAFVVDESSTLPLMIRASWASDEAIQGAAAQLAAPSYRRMPETVP